LNKMIPEYLVLICKFTYASQGKTRYFPNEVRRFLMGKTHQHYKTRQPTKGLPEMVLEEFHEELIIPFYFSLIKQPIMEGILHNPAVGAITIYHVTLLDEELFNKLCLFIYEKVKKHLKMVKDIKILYADEVILHE